MTLAVKEQLGAPIYRKWPDTDTTAYRSSPILYKQEKIPLFLPYLEIHYTLAAFCTALQFYLKVKVNTLTPPTQILVDGVVYFCEVAQNQTSLKTVYAFNHLCCKRFTYTMNSNCTKL